MDQQSFFYYRDRQKAELAAAEASTCPLAQQAHLRLADLYGDLVQRFDMGLPRFDGQAPSHLTILPRD